MAGFTEFVKRLRSSDQGTTLQVVSLVCSSTPRASLKRSTTSRSVPLQCQCRVPELLHGSISLTVQRAHSSMKCNLT